MLLTSLFITVYVWPRQIDAATEMNQYEADRGAGDKPGPITDEKIKESAEWKKLHSRHFELHAYSVISNFVQITMSIIHLWFLSKRFTFA